VAASKLEKIEKLSPGTLRQRRNLLIASVTMFILIEVFQKLGDWPAFNAIPFLGITLEKEVTIQDGLAVTLAYFWVRYLQYLIQFDWYQFRLYLREINHDLMAEWWEKFLDHGNENKFMREKEKVKTRAAADDLMPHIFHKSVHRDWAKPFLLKFNSASNEYIRYEFILPNGAKIWLEFWSLVHLLFFRTYLTDYIFPAAFGLWAFLGYLNPYHWGSSPLVFIRSDNFLPCVKYFVGILAFALVAIIFWFWMFKQIKPNEVTNNPNIDQTTSKGVE